jgi:Domain of unknown function (DUF1330)
MTDHGNRSQRYQGPEHRSLSRRLPGSTRQGSCRVTVHRTPVCPHLRRRRRNPCQWHSDQTVILEFVSIEAARGWYNSPEYQAVVGQRHAAAECNAVIVGGFEMPSS